MLGKIGRRAEPSLVLNIFFGQAVSAAISELLDLGPSASWLAHIAECLEVVEAHVGASR